MNANIRGHLRRWEVALLIGTALFLIAGALALGTQDALAE